MKSLLVAALLFQLGQPSHFPPVNLTAPDLIVFGTPHVNEDRTIGFAVANRSNIASRATQAALYVNGSLKQTFDVPALRGYMLHTLHTTDTWMGCGPLSLRVVVDPGNQIAEADETNNVATNNIASACPDVTASIRKDWVNHNLQYKAEIDVVNKGGVPMPSVTVRTVALPWRPTSTPPPLDQCFTNPSLGCMKDVRTIGPLAPGQKVSFEPGGKYDLAEKLAVKVTIVCGNGSQPVPPQCVESDYSNNTIFKGL